MTLTGPTTTSSLRKNRLATMSFINSQIKTLPNLKMTMPYFSSWSPQLKTVVPNISKTTPINSSPTKEASKTSSGPTVSTTSSVLESVVVPTATKTGTASEPVNTPSSSRASSKKSPGSTDRRAYQEPLAKFPRVEENQQTPDPVSSEFEEIRKLVHPSSNSRRKFPGPAGILPRIHQAIDSQPRLASILSKQDGRTVLNAVGGLGSTGKQQPTPTASTPAADP